MQQAVWKEKGGSGNVEQKVTSERLFFIDNLRWVMIVFVVMVHIVVTYSSIGRWYYFEKTELDILSKAIFGMYLSFSQAYFMGFLFLIAGYFIPAAYDRKGFKRFIQDRMVRLGVPVLIYMLLIHPFIERFLLSPYWGNQYVQSFWYIDYIISLRFLEESGPLWFAFALLFFSLIYALIRRYFPMDKKDDDGVLPGHKEVGGTILFISFFAFMVRLVQPIGTDILNMQLCFFTQYIALFILGVIAYRKDWFLRLPYEFGVVWFKAGFLLGVPLWIVMMVAGGGLNGMEYLYFGGSYWQSAVYALWESFYCICMCLGLIVIFREKFNYHTKWSRLLSDNAFGVYVFHAPILIFISLVLKGWSIHPLLKFSVVTLITLPACFLFSMLIRKNFIIRKVFS